MVLILMAEAVCIRSLSHCLFRCSPLPTAYRRVQTDPRLAFRAPALSARRLADLGGAHLGLKGDPGPLGRETLCCRERFCCCGRIGLSRRDVRCFRAGLTAGHTGGAGA